MNNLSKNNRRVKFFGKLAMVVCLISLVFTGCGTQRYGKLAWEENFSGSTLNANRWSRISRGTADWNRHMTDFDSCYAMHGGKLILRGLRNYSLPNDTAPYITGGVYTKGKVSFGEGLLEVRAKLGEMRGAWPAFWMLPENAKWPKGGEIDIMEHLSHDTIAYQTVHSYYTYVLKHDSEPPHSATGPIKNGKYNIYGVEITKDSLAFYINRHHTFTYPRVPEKASEGQFVFTDKKFYLLLDMQLGGSWVGKVHAEELPVEMQIDWVKYYKK
jgi:hypothetical protein